MLADYYSKHHPAAHHRNMRGEYHTTQAVLDECRARADREASKEIQANLASIKESAAMVVHNEIKAKVEREMALMLVQEVAQQTIAINVAITQKLAEP